jgi:hypothetical protein
MKYDSKLRRPAQPTRPDSDKTKTKEPVLPSSAEGRVESIGAGRGLGRDDDPRTGQPTARRLRGQQPKLSDQRDRFVSSEVAEEMGPQKTTV